MNETERNQTRREYFRLYRLKNKEKIKEYRRIHAQRKRDGLLNDDPMFITEGTKPSDIKSYQITISPKIN
jgi:hypothetical protein